MGQLLSSGREEVEASSGPKLILLIAPRFEVGRACPELSALAAGLRPFPVQVAALRSLVEELYSLLDHLHSGPEWM